MTKWMYDNLRYVCDTGFTLFSFAKDHSYIYAFVILSEQSVLLFPKKDLRSYQAIATAVYIK